MCDGLIQLRPAPPPRRKKLSLSARDLRILLVAMHHHVEDLAEMESEEEAHARMLRAALKYHLDSLRG